MDFYTQFVKARYHDSYNLYDKDPICLNTAYYPSIGFFYRRYGTENSLNLKKAFIKLYDRPRSVKECNLILNGMLALKTVFDHFYNKEDHFIIAHDIYSETKKMINTYKASNIDYIELENYELLKESIKENTKFILLDSMVNPTSYRHDVEKIIEVTKSINPNIKIIIDNTLLSIYYYNPFKDGADIVVESLTKYYNGHGDVLGGLIIGLDLKEIINTYGIELDPISCWLIARGMTTLPIRMDRITNTANIVANELKNITSRVMYSGLGGIMIFTFGSLKDNKRFLLKLDKELFMRATFGQENTLCNINWLPEETEWLPEEWRSHLRLSIGLESPEYIIDSLKKAKKLAKL